MSSIAPIYPQVLRSWTRKTRCESDCEVASFHDKKVDRDHSIRETTRILISPRPPHRCDENVGIMRSESLLEPTQNI